MILSRDRYPSRYPSHLYQYAVKVTTIVKIRDKFEIKYFQSEPSDLVVIDKPDKISDMKIPVSIELKENIDSSANRDEQQVCNKLLKCGNHRCKDKCHDGECKQCDITIEQECFCGKHKKKQNCGTGIKVKVLQNNDEEKQKEIFVWKYSCNNICNKQLSCNNHRCTLICHNSKCQLCMSQVKKRCRCGALEKKFKCHDYHEKLKNYLENNETAMFQDQEDDWIKCGKKCKRIKSCGKHICSEICCPGRNSRTYFEGHQCNQLCNKVLACNHRCESKCHPGICPPCSRLCSKECLQDMQDGYKASYSTGIFGMYPFPFGGETYNEIMKFDKALGDYFADKGRSDYYSHNGLIFSGYGRFKTYVEVCLN